jgi:hypothetical protein
MLQQQFLSNDATPCSSSLLGTARTGPATAAAVTNYPCFCFGAAAFYVSLLQVPMV